MATISEIKKEAKKMLEHVPGISGIGITWDDNGNEILRINVTEEITKEAKLAIPKSIKGVPTKTVIVDHIRAE